MRYAVNTIPFCRQVIPSSHSLGPDAQSSCRVKLDIGQCGSDDTAFSRGVNAFQQLVVDFYASELRLRGDADVVQPHVKDQNILCWNGEVNHLVWSQVGL